MIDFYGCLSKRVKNLMLIIRKACCLLANTFFSRLELIEKSPGVNVLKIKGKPEIPTFWNLCDFIKGRRL